MASVSGKIDPIVRRITVADIAEAFGQGLRDFQAAPLYGLAFGALYAAGGIAILLCLTALSMVYLAYPLAAGFALIGPFVAIGLYEVSRRLEAGEQPTPRSLWAAVTSRSEIGWMAFVTLFVFVVWMYQVRLLIALFLGLVSFASFEQFLTVIFTTQDGLIFLAAGHIVGAVLALVLFSITVISIPLLLEREVDMVTAMITSIKTVFQSPVIMLAWGVFVTLCVLAASIPLFLGLLVVLPVFGHATWHLYRRALP